MLSFLSIKELDEQALFTARNAADFYTKSCEYSYVNLLCWRDVYNTEFAKTENGVIFKMTISGNTYFLCPIVKDKTKAVEEILGYAKETGEATVHFTGLTKDFADLVVTDFGGENLSYDRNNFDYIYDKEKLITFSGKKLHGKKNHLNKFLLLYGDRYEYRVLTENEIPHCLGFNKKWYEDAGGSLSEERVAVEEMLRNMGKHGIFGGCIFIDGSLCAYTIASALYQGSDTVVIHAEKGLYEIPGIYPAICSFFLKNQCDKFTFVNREDDLGDEGLRKSKLSYSPLEFVEKFSVDIRL